MLKITGGLTSLKVFSMEVLNTQIHQKDRDICETALTDWVTKTLMCRH